MLETLLAWQQDDEDVRQVHRHSSDKYSRAFRSHTLDRRCIQRSKYGPLRTQAAGRNCSIRSSDAVGACGFGVSRISRRTSARHRAVSTSDFAQLQVTRQGLLLVETSSQSVNANCVRISSKPPPNPRLVAGVVSAEQTLKNALFRFDLKARYVHRESNRSDQSPQRPQECGPASDYEEEPYIHGISGELVDA